MADLRISALTKSFGGTAILRGVDLAVPSGALFAILGASGSGKTTLLRLLSGFERADLGTIEIDGRVVSGSGFSSPAGEEAGWLCNPGGVALSPPDGRRERRLRAPAAAIAAIVSGPKRCWKCVGLPASYASRGPHELSGGEQQRVALARALAPRPKLVLLDEPFSALDASLRIETRQAVAAILQAAGATALLVTHDQSEALSMGREVAVLRDGVLAQVAPPEDLYRRARRRRSGAIRWRGGAAAGRRRGRVRHLRARAARTGAGRGGRARRRDGAAGADSICVARQARRGRGAGSRRHLLRPRRQRRRRAGLGRRHGHRARRGPHGAWCRAPASGSASKAR